MLKKQKYVTAVFCLFLSFFFAAMGILQYQMIRGKKPVSTDAGIEAMNNDTVLVGGMPIGIYMETDGVMVLNTEQIAGADGKEHEPAKGIVKAGDYIMAVDHCEITGKKELLEAVGNLTGTFVVLTVRRNGETIDLKIKPVEYETGEYRLGIWVRDNVQGLGTVTFLTDQSRFGALGHGIHDVDTSVLMSIAEGNVYRTSIRDITKGQRVESFVVEALTDNGWKEVGKGTTIGYKRMLRFPVVKASQLRVKIDECRLTAHINQVAAYYAAPLQEVVQGEDWNNLPRAGWKQVADSPLTIDLGKSVTLASFTYAPSKAEAKPTMAFRYKFFVSMDGKHWKEVPANGEFSNIMHNPLPQTVTFGQKVQARYIKLEATTPTATTAKVGMDEIGVITTP